MCFRKNKVEQNPTNAVNEKYMSYRELMSSINDVVQKALKYGQTGTEEDVFELNCALCKIAVPYGWMESHIVDKVVVLDRRG